MRGSVVWAGVVLTVSCAGGSGRPEAARGAAAEPAPDSAAEARAEARAQALRLPTGTRFIADARTKRYYPLECEAGLRVPVEAVYFYGDEVGLKRDGYTRAPEC